MARNTGRASVSQFIPTVMGGEWVDSISRGWEVWSEEDGVAVYEGPKESATRRTLLDPEDADRLAEMLRTAARDVRRLS